MYYLVNGFSNGNCFLALLKLFYSIVAKLNVYVLYQLNTIYNLYVLADT